MGVAQKKSNSRLKGKKLEIILILSFLVIILFNLFSAVFTAKNKYTTFEYWKNFSQLKSVYLRSQYVSKAPTAIIPDETVNSYAAGEYINGSNPVLIAADTPPLGRYLIGFSAKIFNNENIVTLVFSSLSLLLMFLISNQIFSGRVISIIPPMIFSFEPIFKNQIIYSPLLDIIQLVFLLSCFYFFNRGVNSKNKLKFFIMTNIFLGFFVSTKFFITGITIVGAWFLVLILRREKERIITLLKAIPISIITFFLSYITLFSYSYSIKSFLGVQKYIFVYHQTQLILPFSIWPLILFNKWYVWFGKNPVISDSQWLITWPIITIISFIAIILYLIKKIPKNINVEVLMLWTILYFLFFSFGQVTSRYFVILVPVLYIISLYGLVSIYKIYKK